MRDCLDARIDALGRELAALRVAVQNGQMAVAQAAGQPPEERAFREGQMAEIATLKQQMATLAAHKNQDFNPERIARIERDLQATRELELENSAVSWPG